MARYRTRLASWGLCACALLVVLLVSGVPRSRASDVNIDLSKVFEAHSDPVYEQPNGEFHFKNLEELLVWGLGEWSQIDIYVSHIAEYAFSTHFEECRDIFSDFKYLLVNYGRHFAVVWEAVPKRI